MAKIYKTDGSKEDVFPKDGKYFSYEELKEIVGGMVEILPLPKSNMLIVINENGKCDGLEKNEVATEIWKREYPIEEYPENNDELIVGNVLVTDPEFIEE